MNKVVAYILNFDKDHNARRIQAALPCENYIIDSSGEWKQGFIKTDTPFAAGCMNKAIAHFQKTDASHILLICSDMIGDWSSVVTNIGKIQGDIGVYTPCVAGQGWAHEKPQGLSLRDIPFAEGMIVCYRRDVIMCLGVLGQQDAHCYGVDIYLSYRTKQMGYRCVADDRVMLYHPHGSGYSQKEGEKQMKEFIAGKGEGFRQFCRSIGLGLPFYKRWARKYF